MTPLLAQAAPLVLDMTMAIGMPLLVLILGGAVIIVRHQMRLESLAKEHDRLRADVEKLMDSLRAHDNRVSSVEKEVAVIAAAVARMEGTLAKILEAVTGRSA